MRRWQMLKRKTCSFSRRCADAATPLIRRPPRSPETPMRFPTPLTACRHSGGSRKLASPLTACVASPRPFWRPRSAATAASPPRCSEPHAAATPTRPDLLRRRGARCSICCCSATSRCRGGLPWRATRDGKRHRAGICVPEARAFRRTTSDCHAPWPLLHNAPPISRLACLPTRLASLFRGDGLAWPCGRRTCLARCTISTYGCSPTPTSSMPSRSGTPRTTRSSPHSSATPRKSWMRRSSRRRSRCALRRPAPRPFCALADSQPQLTAPADLPPPAVPRRCSSSIAPHWCCRWSTAACCTRCWAHSRR